MIVLRKVEPYRNVIMYIGSNGFMYYPHEARRLVANGMARYVRGHDADA